MNICVSLAGGNYKTPTTTFLCATSRLGISINLDSIYLLNTPTRVKLNAIFDKQDN